jgi:hypothetical protein
MSLSALYRIAALALIAGGAVGAVASLLQPIANDLKAQVGSALFYPTGIALLVAGLMMIGAWPAVYLRQRSESGVLGFVGMVGIWVFGAMLAVSFAVLMLLILPWVASLPLSSKQLGQGPSSFAIFFPVVGLVGVLGGALFGVATVRAKVYSRWVGIALIVAVVLSFVLGFLNLPGVLGNLNGVVMDLVIAWFGYELLGKAASEPRTASVRQPGLAPG